MLKITQVHMVPPGTLHEHIDQVWVVDTDKAGSAGWWKVRPTAADHLKNGGKLYVVEQKTVEVRERTNSTGLRYIQTVADGVWANNLLNLPKS